MWCHIFRSCLMVWCLTIDCACWCGFSLSTLPACVGPHYRPCVLVWCLIISHASVCCLSIGYACCCGASRSAVTSGVVPHYRLCLLVWCLLIHYLPCLLVWCLTISHTCWCDASLYAIPSSPRPLQPTFILVKCR